MHWIAKDEAELWRKIMKEQDDYMWRRLLWGYTEEEKAEMAKPENNVKLAFVDLGDGKSTMIGVSNKNMQGYKLDERYPTVKEPKEKQEYKTFIRWATLMDV